MNEHDGAESDSKHDSKDDTQMISTGFGRTQPNFISGFMTLDLHHFFTSILNPIRKHLVSAFASVSSTNTHASATNKSAASVAHPLFLFQLHYLDALNDAHCEKFVIHFPLLSLDVCVSFTRWALIIQSYIHRIRNRKRTHTIPLCREWKRERGTGWNRIVRSPL